MKKNHTVAVLVALGVFALAAVAYAGPHRGNGHGQGWGRGYCGQGYQTLTPEQQEKADAIAQQFFKGTQSLRQEIYAKQAELEALLASGETNQRRIDSTIDELTALRGQLMKKRVEFRQQMAGETGFRIPMGHGGRGMGMGYHNYGGNNDCPGYGSGCYGSGPRMQ